MYLSTLWYKMIPLSNEKDVDTADFWQGRKTQNSNNATIQISNTQ